MRKVFLGEKTNSQPGRDRFLMIPQYKDGAAKLPWPFRPDKHAEMLSFAPICILGSIPVGLS